MAYTAFNEANPTGSGDGATTITQIKANFAAIRDMVVMGSLPGWNMSASGDTTDQPDVLLFTKGVERIRATLTWGTVGGADGNVQVAVYAYSGNSGSSYDTIGTETITYDASANVTATTWS